ncbi:MAG: type II 3-dehydroquinate dehydratase [Desulfobacteraceae bacterium]|nr:MAG: type II 3-dehydroquinate dehydratase [Desulfobacteraceae bacterium]
MNEPLKRVHVLHGPNLNMLGKREPHLYGSETLEEIVQSLVSLAGELNIHLTSFQSNHEGELVDDIHKLFEDGIDGVIINPGAYTHTSVAIRDALLILPCPIIEVHLSNIYKREPFRHKSMITDIATGQIAGLGPQGYGLAVKAMAVMLHDA